MHYAIIDIGSNTIRVVIYDVNKNKAKEIYNERTFAQLRKQVVDNKLLSEGVDLLMKTAKKYIKIAKSYDAEIVPFTTQTIRMVDNQEEILTRFFNETGIVLRVLSKTEESLFGFYGMHKNLDTESTGVYVDLGGGSMEAVYFVDGEVKELHSFSFGSIVLRSLIKHAIPTEKEVLDLTKYISAEIESIEWLKQLKVPLIIVGGSARNTVKLDKSITKRDDSIHGYRIKLAEMMRIRKILMLYKKNELEQIDGFSKERANLIIPSMLAFELLYKYVDAPYMVTSKFGLRDGILIDSIK